MVEKGQIWHFLLRDPSSYLFETAEGILFEEKKK